MEKIEALKKLGLSDIESKIYIEMLKLGPSKVNILSKRLNLPRTTTYSNLDSLISKGFAFYVIKSGVKHFNTIDPKRILSMQEEKLNVLKPIMQELEELKETVGKRPRIETYEGKEGIKTILEEILDMPKKSILYGYVNSDLFEHLEYYFPNFINRRVKNKISAKIIQEKNERMEKLRKMRKKNLLTIKFSPERFKSNVFIFKNKVVLLNFSKGNLIGILIENESIAETQKQVFDLLWKLSK